MLVLKKKKNQFMLTFPSCRYFLEPSRRVRSEVQRAEDDMAQDPVYDRLSTSSLMFPRGLSAAHEAISLQRRKGVGGGFSK